MPDEIAVMVVFVLRVPLGDAGLWHEAAEEKCPRLGRGRG
jgi:hypothetical protein